MEGPRGLGRGADGGTQSQAGEEEEGSNPHLSRLVSPLPRPLSGPRLQLGLRAGLGAGAAVFFIMLDLGKPKGRAKERRI